MKFAMNTMSLPDLSHQPKSTLVVCLSFTVSVWDNWSLISSKGPNERQKAITDCKSLHVDQRFPDWNDIRIRRGVGVKQGVVVLHGKEKGTVVEGRKKQVWKFYATAHCIWSGTNASNTEWQLSTCSTPLVNHGSEVNCKRPGSGKVQKVRKKK